MYCTDFNFSNPLKRGFVFVNQKKKILDSVPSVNLLWWKSLILSNALTSLKKNIRICFRAIGTREEKDGNYRLLYITSVEFSSAMTMWLMAPPYTEEWPNSPHIKAWHTIVLPWHIHKDNSLNCNDCNQTFLIKFVCFFVSNDPILSK